MRLLVVLLAGVTGLAAQVTAPDAAAKLKQFEQNLEKAMRSPGGPGSGEILLAPSRVCAIPLLRVRPDASFKSNMPLIAPDPKIKFSARELIPPGPVCDDQTRK